MASQTASDASTLGSDKRMLGFITSSMVGVVCFILWPDLGFFLSFSTLGHLLISWCNPTFIPFVRDALMKMVETRSKLLFNCIKVVTGPLKHLTQTRLLAVIICLLLTLCAAFWRTDVDVGAILMTTRLAMSGVMVVYLSVGLSLGAI